MPGDGDIGSGVIFKKALDKHGVEAFNREIIALTWLARWELLNIEEEILIAVDARGDQMSYNTKNKGLGSIRSSPGDFPWPRADRGTQGKESPQSRDKGLLGWSSERSQMPHRGSSCVMIAPPPVQHYNRKLGQAHGAPVYDLRDAYRDY